MSQRANASELAQMEAPSESVNPEHGLPESFGEGFLGRLLFWIAVSFSTFQIITSFGIPLDKPFIASVSLTHLWAVTMVAWAAWVIGLAVRGRSVVDGVLAWIAIAPATRNTPAARKILDDYAARGCGRDARSDQNKL